MQIAGIIILIIAVLGILVFILRQNFKDRKKLTNQLNQDYKKTKDEEGDIDIDEIRH
jgi:preprotein translocase subunit YajC